jgi:hypothetical protein
MALATTMIIRYVATTNFVLVRELLWGFEFGRTIDTERAYMLTAEQCFIHIVRLAKTGDERAFELAVTYANQVPPSEIGPLRDKVGQELPSRFTSGLLDILDTRQAYLEG